MEDAAMGANRFWVMWFVGGVIGAAAVAGAQPQPPMPAAPPEDTLFFLSNAAPVPAFGGRIDIIRGEGDVLGPVVKDKPYSARSLTESTQTLADGNRIVQRNEALIFRDSAGRTRREQTLNGVGPWQAGAPVTMINIHDPVAGKTYVLDPATRTAREARPFRMEIARAQAELEDAVTEVRTLVNGGASPAGPPGEQNVTLIRRRERGAAEDVQVLAAGTAVGMPPIAVGVLGGNESVEDLGEQVLEGLLVSGSKLVNTIPAGTLGNERPIEIVTERWYSQDIDAIVLHRYSDPRFGERTYRLVNVVRGDPSPDLFELPQGYEVEVVEAPQMGIRALPGTPGQRFEYRLRREPPGSTEQERN
jgi:hypothetical protein